MRRTRILTSWVNTLLLTAAVALGVINFSHHATTPTASAATTTSTTAPAAVTTAATSPVISRTHPITISFRGDDGSRQTGDY